MKLRRLTANGIQKFGEFLDSLNTPTPQGIPSWLLDDVATSTEIGIDIDLADVKFATRFEFAKYLDSKLTESGLKNIDRDAELWAWLALFYFDQLAPENDVGERSPGERARWLLAVEDYRKYYRHLVAGPYSIYRAHRDNPRRAMAVLAGPLDKPGDIAEQMASRQELVTNKAAMELATRLYIDPETQRVKRGAAGRGPGSARRFADVLNQFDLTWDLYSMQMDGLITMLPKEFTRFL